MTYPWPGLAEAYMADQHAICRCSCLFNHHSTHSHQQRTAQAALAVPILLLRFGGRAVPVAGPLLDMTPQACYDDGKGCKWMQII